MHPLCNSRQIILSFVVVVLLLLTNITAFAAMPAATNNLLAGKEAIAGQDVALVPTRDSASYDSASYDSTSYRSNIFGLVWTDFNQNGLHDEVEPMAAEQTIFITPNIESDFAQILVLTTDQQGRFQAGNLQPGQYRIWAASQNAADALIVAVAEDRAIMTVQLPLAAHMLYIPDIRG